MGSSGCLGAAPAIVFGPPVNYSIDTKVNRLCSGDFNGDRKLDLAALTGEFSGGVQVTLWTNDGRGGFAVCTNHPTTGTGRVIAAGDVNNDGNLDLVTVNAPLDSVSAFLGHGNGTFERRSSGLTVNFVNPGLALGDFNGDGWLDAAVGAYDMRILLGNGSGFFSVFTNYATRAALVYAVVAPDLGSDGRLDLATADYSSSSTSVFAGQGDGTFGAPTNYSGDFSEYHYSVAVGDFNGDAKPDLVTANQYHGSVSVRLNNGDGTFGPETRYRLGPPIHSVITADFNADGRLDIAADLGRDQSSLALWPGNGDGTFGLARTNFTSNYSYPTSQSLVAGDFDGDGLLDLATTRGTTNAITVRLNQSVARLEIERVANRFSLSWPNWSGYVLQFNFVSPGNMNAWFDSQDPVAVVDNRRVVTNSVESSFVFFRLRRPLP